MPHFTESPRLGSLSGNSPPRGSGNTQRILSDEEYAEVQLMGSQELPLSQQLEPIAVVGMSCRLPGHVKSTSDFWRMMMNKESGQTPKVPPSRFNIDAHFHPNNERPGSFNVKGGYFLHETLHEFDPAFFGITALEAIWMDPQQRKLLEVVYETFESAGITLEQVSNSDTACFMATFTADFQQMSFKEPSFRHSLAATGVDPGLISNRISHVFNLKGPSIVVNTACSSSVYAVHNACNALRNGECSAAIVGGSNLILTVDQHINTAKLGVLSPTSTCHTFNAHADGYGRAEGVGAVYLKRLRDAIRDGDAIRGVIRSSATNNNGKVAGVGITHPSFDGQSSVIRHAYRRGGQLDARLTGYFECHGTGTAIGDPLEVRAVANSMNADRMSEHGPLYIGAVKTSIGHSEAASGLSAVIKAILAVERKTIPPTYGVTDLNPKIDWTNWKVCVPDKPTPFPDRLQVCRVSVNSFGYGGTNAHIIVEGADSLLALPQSYRYADHGGKPKMLPARGKLNRGRPSLLVFSAHDKSTLKRNIVAHSAAATSYDILDLSYTLANHRSTFPSRGMVVSTPASLEQAFGEGLDDFVFAENKKASSIGFVFTGQGAQWARMSASLMVYYPTFRQSIRTMDSVLEGLDDAPDWTLEDVLLEDEACSRINEAEFSQCLCTAVQVALVQLLQLWGVKPEVTCGHSSGEIAAAFAAGIITASEAIILAFYRGKAVGNIRTNGAMLAVGLGAEAVAPYVAPYAGDVGIACHNSPSGVTLSGDVVAIESISEQLANAGIFARLVRTGGKAYHSKHMQPAAETYESFVRHVRKDVLASGDRLRSTTMVSSVTGDVVSDGARLDEKYWSANLLSPVLFNQAIQVIGTKSEFSHIDVLIEIGPHSALAGPIKQIMAEHKFDKLQYLPSLVRGSTCASSLLRLAGELFLRSYPLDLKRVTSVEEEASDTGKIVARKGHMIVDLPPYQWDKSKTYWSESRTSREHRGPRHSRHDLLGQRIIGGSLAEPTWRNVLRLRDVPWLKDHSLGGEAVFPAAGYFSMAIEAVTQLNELSSSPVEISNYVLRNVSIQQALVTPDDDDGIEVLLSMSRGLHLNGNDERDWWDFHISSVSLQGQVKKHMSGSIGTNSRRRPMPKHLPILTSRASGKSWNQALKEVGFNYGPSFQDMDDITFDGSTYAAHAATSLKTTVAGMVGESRYVLHPACIDSCLQLMIVAIWAGRADLMKFGAVPVEADQVTIWRPTAEQLSDGRGAAFSWIDPRGLRSFNAHNQLMASNGQLLMDISNMRCAAYEAAIPLRAGEPPRAQPYSHLVSRQDVDSLSGTQPMDAAEYTGLTMFKYPGQKILSVDGFYAHQILANHRHANLTVSTSSGNKTDAVATQFADQDTKPLTADSGASTSDFDLVIAQVSSLSQLTNVSNLLREGGRAILELPASLDAADCANAHLQDLGVALAGDARMLRVAQKSEAITGPENGIKNGFHAKKLDLAYYGEMPALVRELDSVLGQHGFDVRASCMANMLPEESITSGILVTGFGGLSLESLTRDGFEALKKFLDHVSNLVWISPGGLLDGNAPECAMAAGLLRSLRAERPSLTATFADFDMETMTVKSVASLAAQLVVRQADKDASLEAEYYFSAGKTYISRLLPDDESNSAFLKGQEVTESRPFDTSLRLSGLIQAGRVVFEQETHSDGPALEPEQVEVQVHASGLDEECVQIMAGTEFQSSFSHEIAGTITRIGAAVTRFREGDGVVGFSSNKFASFQTIDQRLVHKMLKEEQASCLASLPKAYGMAVYGLETLANLQPGEKVLILPGTGSPGAAAINMTRALGGKPHVAVQSDSERPFAKKRFGLEPDEVLEFSEWTQGARFGPFDIIFSAGTVDDGIANEAWKLLPPSGRFINCGHKRAWGRQRFLETGPFLRGASYLSFDMMELVACQPAMIRRLLERVVGLYRQRRIRPLELAIHNIAKLNACVASFSSALGAPKVVLEHKACEETMEVLPLRPRVRLRGDATYLLVGCLGGLGRSISSWMLDRGARNLTYLSRTGTDSPQAQLLVDEMTAMGANVEVIRGDASVQEDVQRALHSVPPNRPLKGVINAAMVLRDTFFYSMSYQHWQACIRPKVWGSRTLHQQVSDLPLDFFIMTSSVSGILGTPGQSNYAAGNAYMDALAQHRHSRGMKAASVILPMILGVGVVSENVELEASLKRKGMYGVDAQHVLDALELAMMEQQRSERTDPLRHIVAGMDASLLQKAKQGAGGDVDVFWERDARFRSLLHDMKAASRDGSDGSRSDGTQDIMTALRAAGDTVKARGLVRQHLVGKLSRMLMADVDEFEDGGRSIVSFGVDSMIGAELRSWIFREFGLDIAFQQLLAPGLSLVKFSELVCEKQGLDGKDHDHGRDV